jgi:hypothetical protein
MVSGAHLFVGEKDQHAGDEAHALLVGDIGVHEAEGLEYVEDALLHQPTVDSAQREKGEDDLALECHTSYHTGAKADGVMEVPLALDLLKPFVGEGTSEILVQSFFGLRIQFPLQHGLAAKASGRMMERKKQRQRQVRGGGGC